MARQPARGRHAGAILPLCMLLSFGVASCQAEAPVPAQAPVAQGPILGRILVPERQVAALVSDVANGATVSLIDGVTGTTVASSVSSPQGAFSLNLGTFSPVAGRPYFLEAAKGLAAGGPSQRAGAAIARLRTLLFFQSGDWVSLNSSAPGDAVLIGWASTAVAAIASLKGLAPLDQQNLIGKVASNGFAFNPTGTSLTAAEFASVYQLVDEALGNDQDPWEVVAYDATSGQFGKRPTSLVLHATLAPAKTTPGGTITVTGQNLPAPRNGVTVTVGSYPVTWSVNADRTQMTLNIPANGYSGVLRVTQGTSQWHGPFVPVSGSVGTLAGTGIVGHLDGPGNLAQLGLLHGIAVDGAGTVYVAESSNNRIRKIEPNGMVSTFAGSGTAGSASGTGTAAQFTSPIGLCLDPTGNLYATENAGGSLIRKITPAGAVTTFAGSGTPGYAEGTGTGASFNLPYGISADSAGNLYVTDNANYRIRKITPGGVTSTLAGSGTAGFQDGAPGTAQFSSTSDLVVDAAGNVYVCDRGGQRIRKVTTTGTVSTLAGSGTGAFADGTGTAASFNEPTGIDLAANGDLYVYDASNYRIRKVTSTGVVTTVAGDGQRGYKDGPALQAQFYGAGDPTMLAVGANGFVYVVDVYQPHVRVYVP